MRKWICMAVVAAVAMSASCGTAEQQTPSGYDSIESGIDGGISQEAQSSGSIPIGETPGMPNDKEETAVDSKLAGKPPATDIEGTLEWLVHENWRCVREIFYLGHLPFAPHAKESNAPDMMPVQTEDIKTFDDLKACVESVYCEAESKALLYGSTGYPPYAKRYMDDDGALLADERTLGGVGYYYVWDDPKVTIVDLTDERCDFQVAVQEDVLGTVSEDWPMTFDMAAVKEGGEWKLEKMVY